MRVLEDAKGTKSVALYEQQKDMERKRDKLAAGAAAAEKALALSHDNQVRTQHILILSTQQG